MVATPSTTLAADTVGPGPLAPHDDDGDEGSVERAVSWLRTTVNRQGLELARAVHRYLLDAFFGGSYAAFADPSGHKPQSFAALCARDDLPLSHASLSALVRVGEQLLTLPADVAEALSVRHHRALLPLADPDDKRRLAERAAAEGWTAEALEAAVRSQRPDTSRGRKPLPAALKTARALRRTLDAPLAHGALGELTEDERLELEDALAVLEAHLAALRTALAAPDEA